MATELRDARGRAHHPAPPDGRFVSLVPSTTETLFALGVGPRVAGITNFCVRPPRARATCARVGGTKDADPARIRALDPALVFANCEENTLEVLDALDAFAPVWAALPKTVEGALDDLEAVGRLVGVEARARALADDARAAWRALEPSPFRYAYVIWREPWMTVSDDTFIAAFLAGVGGVNVFGRHADRFPTFAVEHLADHDVDAVLLASEPFAFREKHRAEVAARSGLPVERVHQVDGQACSWHGVRLAASIPWLDHARRAWIR
jgi:ABC-type Fe3+-hydroxamate transport system substrate-binding protein